MNIQIFGTTKCFDTKKAERYFKERKIKYQMIDILRFGLSKRELESVSKSVGGLRELVNKSCREYEIYNMAHFSTPSIIEEMLTKHPKLYRTPVVRNGKDATIGYQPDIWKDWE